MEHKSARAASKGDARPDTQTTSLEYRREQPFSLHASRGLCPYPASGSVADAGQASREGNQCFLATVGGLAVLSSS